MTEASRWKNEAPSATALEVGSLVWTIWMPRRPYFSRSCVWRYDDSENPCKGSQMRPERYKSNFLYIFTYTDHEDALSQGSIQPQRRFVQVANRDQGRTLTVEPTS